MCCHARLVLADHGDEPFDLHGFLSGLRLPASRSIVRKSRLSLEVEVGYREAALAGWTCLGGQPLRVLRTFWRDV